MWLLAGFSSFWVVRVRVLLSYWLLIDHPWFYATWKFIPPKPTRERKKSVWNYNFMSCKAWKWLHITLCHILLVRSKSQVSPMLKGRLTQRREYQEPLYLGWRCIWESYLHKILMPSIRDIPLFAPCVNSYCFFFILIIIHFNINYCFKYLLNIYQALCKV